MAMVTIDLSGGRNKKAQIAAFLDGLLHVPSDAPGLASYHAAKRVVYGALRCGHDRQLNAVRKAVKQFNVVCSIGRNTRGDSAVRLYSPVKQIEIYL